MGSEQKGNLMRQRLVLFVRALVAVSLAATGLIPGASPSSAQELPAPQGIAASLQDLDRCDVADFSQTKLVDAAEPYSSYPGVAVGQTDVVQLPATIPAGRILVSGTTFDEIHLDDVPDFLTTISQFGEHFAVRFLGADGSVVGETDPTPDLPDFTPIADFALPSIDLTGPATAIQLIHAGDGSSANSVYAECINVDVVGDNPDPTSLIRPALCPVDALALGPEFLCGFYSVPEERDDPNSRLISIAFALLPGDGTHADPVFYLEGGPGGSPMWVAGLITELGMGQAADGRDIVFVDQRGTGYSQPNLVCPFDPGIEYGPGEFAQACGESLVAAGVNLSAYTTVENGADVASLRVAMGYDEYNLFGGSYGTDVGLTIMRDNPEGVRSSVLDSVFPPVVNNFVDQGIGVLKMLDAVVERCETDADCNAQYPDLRTTIIAAFDNTAAEPTVVDDTAADFLAGGPIVVDPFLLFSVVSGSLGDPTLPALLDALADPDPAARLERTTAYIRLEALAQMEEILADLLGPAGPPPPEETPSAVRAALERPTIADKWGVPGPGTMFSDGFSLTVICAEEAPFADQGGATEPSTEGWTGAIVEVADGTAFPVSPGSLEEIVLDCEKFGTSPEDPKVTEAVTSDIPSLVLYTDVDVQTVPEWSVLTAETLTNSFLFEFPNLSHVVTFADPCPAAMVAEFFSAPTAEPDSACIDELPQIDYTGDVPIDPGPIDDAVAEFEAILEEIFGPDGGPPPLVVANATSVDEIMSASDYDSAAHASILRLYQAIFGRYPDVDGAKYWIGVNNGGFSVVDIAGSMSVSQEWAATYGDASNADFVAAVYTNVLGRDYDQAGFDYWLGLLDDGSLARHELVFHVTANVEFTNAYPFQG